MLATHYVDDNTLFDLVPPGRSAFADQTSFFSHEEDSSIRLA